MIYFDKDFIKFFKELERNNSKMWFDENRKRYHKIIKEPTERFVNDLIDAYRSVDQKIDITHRDAMFRINRDIRFSKDKTPYKTHVGAVICKGGKKNMKDPCMYVEINSKEVRLYSGLYMVEKDDLENLRKYIVKYPKKFEDVISDKKFKKVFGKILGDKNKRIKKEFQEAGKKQPLIYNKSFYYFTKYKSDIILKGGLIERLMKDYEVASDMNNFLKKGIRR